MADEDAQMNTWSWWSSRLSMFSGNVSFAKNWPLAVFLSCQAIAVWFIFIPHPLSGLVFSIACIIAMVVHYSFGPQTGRRAINYATIFNVGLFVLRMNYGELNHTFCVTTVDGSASDHFQNGTPSLQYRPFQSRTRCVVWELNPANAVSEAFTPSCITSTDIFTAHQQQAQELISNMRQLGINSTIVDSINKWLNELPGMFVVGQQGNVMN